MARRYLELNEVDYALRRGKAVEYFAGACSRAAQPGICWISFRLDSGFVTASIYETADLGSKSFTDIYEFGPLDPELEFEEAKEILKFSDLQSCLEKLTGRFSNIKSHLVNEFMVQDEYADFIARGRS